ncbi:MAG TPA: class I SAM-dependent methyltransferase [Candidatus Eisenbacteria bacterium]|jgi:demethylmenaquinone methyltransferase/2-methoxy-6-polyprenyl-1,4-benzoquinol methylase|nr:class I SAM-dependent methyltransferase [Candidatus Eisenbacteria bacterium]
MPLVTREWPRPAAARRNYVDAIFGRIAPRYDLLTRVLSFGQDRRWKEAAIAALPATRDEGAILDLATGTAELPLLARARGRRERVVAVDRSRAMLERGREKVRDAGVDRIRFVAGDLNAVPIASNSFDAVLIGYGLRYPVDLRATLAGILQTLRPGGVFIALDFGIPRNGLFRRIMYGYLLSMGTLWGVVLHGRPGTYWHIVESLRAYPGQHGVARMMEEVGFTRVTVQERLLGSSAIVRGERPAY